MALPTIAAIVDRLLRRCDRMMIKVGMDGATRTSSNLDLVDPIGVALADMGYPPADAFSLTDSDVAVLTDGPTMIRFLDMAEKRILETCWAKVTDVDAKQGDDEQKLSQLRDALLERIKDLEERIRKPYGLEVTGPAIARMPHHRHNDQTRGNPRRWPYR